jgi:predicted DNA-binding protein
MHEERKPGAMPVINVRLPWDLKQRLQAATKDEDLTQAQIVRKAIREYLDGLPPQRPMI